MLKNMPNLDNNFVNPNAAAEMGNQFNNMQLGNLGGQQHMQQMPLQMQQQMQQQMQPPPMPAAMQQIASGASMNPGMMGQMNGMPPMNGMGQMNQQLQVPMMNNPMSQFMGMPQQQGGATPLQKYKLVRKDNSFFF